MINATSLHLPPKVNSSSMPQKNKGEMLEIPREILNSRLMRRGGFDIFNGLVDELIKNSLLAEAINQQEFGYENNVVEPDAEERRGGVPPRSFVSSSGGDYQQGVYHAKWLIDFLRDLTTPFLKPTGDNGTYSYYLRPGDFLDIHRDIVTCDVAVITCLKNQFGENKGGGKLCLYPERIKEPLSAVRAASSRGTFEVTLEESQTIVMYGGLIPHALLPLDEGQQRIVSVLCYAAL